MKMVDKYGTVMVEISSVERKGDDLVMTAKMLGTMPGTIYIKPEEAWKGIRLLSFSVLCYLPLFLLKSWLRREVK